MSKKVLERVELAADEWLGQGSAVSIDKKPSGYVITIWDKKGEAALVVGPHPTSDDALRTTYGAIKQRSITCSS